MWLCGPETFYVLFKVTPCHNVFIGKKGVQVRIQEFPKEGRPIEKKFGGPSGYSVCNFPHYIVREGLAFGIEVSVLLGLGDPAAIIGTQNHITSL